MERLFVGTVESRSRAQGSNQITDLVRKKTVCSIEGKSTVFLRKLFQNPSYVPTV